MKAIIYISQFLKPGAVENLSLDLSYNLIKLGCEVDLVVNDCEYKYQINDKRILKIKSDFKIHFLEIDNGINIQNMTLLIIKLRNILINNNINFIETTSRGTSIIASLACIKIATIHIAGIHQVYETFRENSFIYKLWGLLAKLSKKNRYYAVSLLAMQKWIDYARIGSDQIHLVHNSLSLSILNYKINDNFDLKKEFNIPNSCNIVINAGRVCKDKGQDITLKGLIPLLKKYNIHLFFIGDVDLGISGTQDMLNEMDDLIRHNNVSNFVHFLGYRKDIYDLMSSADLLVHTPRAEAFGLILIEAMYLGLPIISSNAEAISEVLNGSDTLVLEKNNPRSLQKFLDIFFSLKNEEIKKIKLSGISHVKKYSSQLRATKILEIYNNNYY